MRVGRNQCPGRARVATLTVGSLPPLASNLGQMLLGHVEGSERAWGKRCNRRLLTLFALETILAPGYIGHN